MCGQCIFFCFILLTIAYSKIRGCIEGELWYEVCKQCRCLKNGTQACQLHLPSCRFGTCIKNVVIFKQDHRCHCKEDGKTVCVPLSYQTDLEGKSCTSVSYYYDNCTYCICDPFSKITKCTPINNCALSRGGICNEEEEVMENCYRCSCTFTKFRVCSPVPNCFLRKEKPGKCYSIEDFYSSNIKAICTSVKKQECYTDYGCLGTKKCCQIVDCYLQCVEPDFT